MTMNKFENINSPKFNQMAIKKIKYLKGGYTSDTFNCYSNGSSGDDGSACDDGMCND